MMKLFLAVLLFSSMGVAKASEAQMSVAQFFNEATYENMETVCKKFYSQNIKFVDPLGEVNGVDNIVKYYKNLYENVISIKFIPLNEFDKKDEKVFVWQMELQHKKVGGGSPIVMEGVSVFRYEGDKVVYHRDYFDLGAMIYEKVPVLGGVIRWIKKKAHSVQ